MKTRSAMLSLALGALATVALALPQGEAYTSNAARSVYPPLRPRQVTGSDSFDVLQRELHSIRIAVAQAYL